MHIKVIGHRGYGPTYHLSGSNSVRQAFPENSLDAFSDVLDRGAEGLELDVQLTKDGIPVALHAATIHEYVLQNLPANKTIQDYTFDEIKNLDIGGGHKIPKIEDVIDLLSTHVKNHDPDCTINLDIKDPNSLKPLLAILEDTFYRNALRPENVFICSYDWDVLRQARSLSSDVQLAACLKTVKLFGKDGVKMPGYVPIRETYIDGAIDQIKDLHDEIGLYAVDCAIADIKPELVKFGADHNIGLAVSTGDNRVEVDITNFETLRKHIKNSGLPFFIFKADEPVLAKQSLYRDFGHNSPFNPQI